MKNASGKLVIIGIVSVALAAAGISWWFRYAATHRTVEFWGPKTARLIRDAPTVQFWPHDPPADLETVVTSLISTDNLPDPASIRNVADAPGFLHMRNALLDNRSFRWPAIPPPSGATWKWVLAFKNEASSEGSIILFTPDCKHIADFDHPERVLSCESISAGLAKLFAEFSKRPAAGAR